MYKFTGIAPELNYLDCAKTLSALTAPSQGDAYNQRDGSKITIKSILIQGSLYIPNQNDQTTCDFVPIVTIALVLDKQTNGSTLNSEDVYTNLFR